MKKILVFKHLDVFNKNNYQSMQKTFDRDFGGRCPNFGNKLWYQGIFSEVSTPENEITFYDRSRPIEELNDEFDMVLFPMANIFSKEFGNSLNEIADAVERFTIPVYVISCGAQADSYDELDDLVKAVGKPSKRFISAVYNTGGQFALRGYFTAEYFKKLGFNDAAVVGCPSLFQLGRDLKIEKKDVSLKDFKPSFNGKFTPIKPYLDRFENSVFYDQDIFCDVLYNPDFFDKTAKDKDNAKKLLKYNEGGVELAKLIDSNRIKLIADMWDWQDSFRKENITFSFGSRIHGSVMPILSGVPAVVVGFDSRTKEMAELYDIPCISSFDEVKPAELYSFYEKLDYSNFNKKFAEKFDAFENFLIKCGLVEKINTDNKFLNREDSDSAIISDYINDDAKRISRLIVEKKGYYERYLKAYGLYSKLLHR